VSIAGSGSLGLEASDTDLQAGDTVGAIQFRSNESSTTSPPADDIVAQISAVANAQHTAGYWPTDLIFSTVNGSNVLSESMRIKPGGNVGIGTANPQAPLHVNGVVRATDICDENGANCKDISGGWGGGGDIDGVYTGTGLTGGFASGSGTLSVDVGTTANKIVQLDASARLPAVNGSQLTNVNAAQLQTREVASTAPTAAQVLGWNAGSSQWEPQTVSVAGGGGFAPCLVPTTTTL
jgi:hypothetical protein